MAGLQSHREKVLQMFENGTTLDGALNLMPSRLSGSGIINMTDSRITSNLFSFAANSIKADTADYNLKSSDYQRIFIHC